MKSPTFFINTKINRNFSFLNLYQGFGPAAKTVVFMLISIFLTVFLGRFFPQILDLLLRLLGKIAVFFVHF